MACCAAWQRGDRGRPGLLHRQRQPGARLGPHREDRGEPERGLRHLGAIGSSKTVTIPGKGKDEPVRVEKAFPAIVSKTKFRRVKRLMQPRAPKVLHLRRVGAPIF